MRDEDKPEVEETPQTFSEETVEAQAEGTPPPAQEEPTSEREPPKWEYRTRFRINDEMTKVVGLTIKATEHELVALRRKLNKLTYGS